MRLYKGCTILGNSIKVERVDNLFTMGDRFGDWQVKHNLIRIQTPRRDIPADVIGATLYHELLHAALDLTGHSKLSEDEEFVERLSQALYQAEKTRRYK